MSWLRKLLSPVTRAVDSTEKGAITESTEPDSTEKGAITESTEPANGSGNSKLFHCIESIELDSSRAAAKG